MVGLLLVGLIPFAVLGILLGHLLTADSLAPAVGGTTSLFALLGGAYGFQLATSGPLFDFMRRSPRTGSCRPERPRSAAAPGRREGWIVIAIWTVVLTPLAVLVYRRDTEPGLSSRRRYA